MAEDALSFRIALIGGQLEIMVANSHGRPTDERARLLRLSG
jgi:hypothetical protein